MIESAILIGTATFLSAVLFFERKRAAQKDKKDESLSRLEDVIKTTELTNNGFFRSLELVQKNLESLLARAESAEQRLRSLMLQPGVEKKEQYTAAALLLGEGQDPQRVASVLNLPLPQVQIVQELQKMSSKERKATMRRKREEEPLKAEVMHQTKNAAPREKTAAAPILLVDVIRSASNGSVPNGQGHTPFGGITA